MQAYLVVAVAVVALVGFSSAEETTTSASAENSCATKFKEDPKRVNVSNACIEKTGLKPEDMPATEEEFTKKFDDKCYGKCLLSELGMLKDLKFDRDAIKADIVEHVVDKEFQAKITAYTLECIDTAEKSGPLTDDNVCKASAQLLYCCKKEEQKLPC
ncbi:unnamed protein product [Orchesella dallaii]|uniref:Uncharacterized protein n=1 Tax=Orchesella dallaii TaxID=48710 RepID=A0ABP1PU99_9HEXA